MQLAVIPPPWTGWTPGTALLLLFWLFPLRLRIMSRIEGGHLLAGSFLLEAARPICRIFLGLRLLGVQIGLSLPL